MKSGLLWFDGDKEKTFFDKLDDAVTRYYQKFGTPANVAFANPSEWPEGTAQPFDTGTSCGRVHVTPKATILRNHIWVGVQDTERR